jgi:hypothetical protein
MNEKSQLTKQRIYLEERKRGIGWGIKKEVIRQLKSTEKQVMQTKAGKSSQLQPCLRGQGPEVSITR